MTFIVASGREIPVPFNVQDGRTMSLWWEPGSPGTRRREFAPSLVVWHHQGGEGAAHQLYNTLHGGRRGKDGKPSQLSIHFGIDYEGNVTQFADPGLTVCFHAGPIANRRSIGIEIANKGLHPEHPNYPRASYLDSVHGRAKRFLRFTPAQVESAKDLFMALSAIWNIPRQFPTINGRVRRAELDEDLKHTFKGHVGHFHLAGKKIDPSPHILDDLCEYAQSTDRPALTERL